MSASNIAVGLFSFLSLGLSLVCWIILFQLGKAKTSLSLLDKRFNDLRQEIPSYKLKLQSLSPQNLIFQNVLSPYAIVKFVEIALMLRAGKLSKLTFLKALFK